MAIRSMTGFARISGSAEGHAFAIELKTVNAKGLDIRLRLPSAFDDAESVAKEKIRKALGRGAVFVTVTAEREDADEEFVINEGRLHALVRAATAVKTEGVAPARMDGLLAIKGVVDLFPKALDEDTRQSLRRRLLEGLEEGLQHLVEAREGEGRSLQADLERQLETMTDLVGRAERAAGDRIEAMHARFSAQLSKLLGENSPVSSDRLDQEIALLAVKADIQEELDRLSAHIREAGNLLTKDTPVGRRLDFLCQEFNREANTLCSKSGDAALTRIGLDLKSVIEQFREQIQNIE